MNTTLETKKEIDALLKDYLGIKEEFECTVEYHATISTGEWCVEETVHLQGYSDERPAKLVISTDNAIEMRNCRRCQSTLTLKSLKAIRGNLVSPNYKRSR